MNKISKTVVAIFTLFGFISKVSAVESKNINSERSRGSLLKKQLPLATVYNLYSDGSAADFLVPFDDQAAIKSLVHPRSGQATVDHCIDEGKKEHEKTAKAFLELTELNRFLNKRNSLKSALEDPESQPSSRDSNALGSKELIEDIRQLLISNAVLPYLAENYQAIGGDKLSTREMVKDGESEQYTFMGEVYNLPFDSLEDIEDSLAFPEDHDDSPVIGDTKPEAALLSRAQDNLKPDSAPPSQADATQNIDSDSVTQLQPDAVTEPQEGSMAETQGDLTSESDSPLETKPIAPPESDTQPVDQDDAGAVDDPDSLPVTIPVPIMSANVVIRPEAGVYLGNLTTANTLFTTRMHHRIGDTALRSTIEDSQDSLSSSMWLRIVGGHNKTRVMDGLLATHTYTQLAQVGGEVMSGSTNGTNGLRLGVMLGTGKSRTRSLVTLSGLAAQGGIKGYSTGLYAIWHANESNREGLYLDGSLSYSWFGNEVLAQPSKNGTASTYRSRGLVGALESGYTRKIFTGETVDAFIQPQLQVTWMGVNVRDRIDEQNQVTVQGNNNIQTRAGSRIFINGYPSQIAKQKPAGQDKDFQFYLETSWLHNSATYGVRVNNVHYTQDGTKNIAEIKIGTEGMLTEHLALWASFGQQKGGGGFQATVGTLGAKVGF